MDELDTKVTRILEANDVPYRVLPHDEAVYTVDAAAAQRGVIREEMVKSLLLRDRKRRYVLACVTGDNRVDPKAVRAHLTGEWKRLSFASAEEIARLTGYIQGAVTPLGLPDDVPILFDEAIADCDKVNISSGDPMAGVELSSRDLIRLSGAQLAPIAEDGD